MLDGAFTLDGIADIVEVLVVNEQLQVIPLGETFDLPFAMLERAARQIAGDAGIENAGALVGNEIDPAAGRSRI